MIAKPEEFNYGPGPLPRLFRRPGSFAIVMFADSSVRRLRDTIPETTLRAAFTRDGGEQFNLPDD